MSAKPHACPVCGETRKLSSIRFRCQPIQDGFVEPCANATQLAIERAERIAQLEGILETAKGWLENVAIKHVGPVHLGPCGPDAGCDLDCMEAASLSAFLEKVNTALKETP